MTIKIKTFEEIKENLETVSKEYKPDSITIPIVHFNYLIIESFRYALLRDKTIASIDCANKVKMYWKYIQDDFKRQIKRDVKNALDNNLITEQDTIDAWMLVLKLND